MLHHAVRNWSCRSRRFGASPCGSQWLWRAQFCSQHASNSSSSSAEDANASVSGENGAWTRDSQSPQRPIRVRYAPSPTGYLHLGGLRTALFNYLFAKSNGGTFILRIEDTDQTRKVEGSVEALAKSLKWCGIEEDEGPNRGGAFGPYIQSQRTELYRQHADKLIQDGHAYRCFCTPERLQKLRENQHRHGEATMYDRACLGLSDEEIQAKLAEGVPYTVRLKIPPGKTIVKDLLRGYVTFEHAGIDDQVLIKSDGFPTYHLANVVDDHAMQISHVIRGEEWLPSTPKHLVLYKALGFEAPQFAHLGLLLNTDRSKLSKRQGDVAVEDFQAKGYLPAGLVNFVALLGWNPAKGNNQEVFTMKELTQHFSMHNVNKAGSIVNEERLRWINSRHIRAMFEDANAEEETQAAKQKRLGLVLQFLPFIAKEIDQEFGQIMILFGVEYIYRAMDLMKERVWVAPEFGPLCACFFQEPDLTTEVAQQMKAKYITHDTASILEEVSRALEVMDDDDFEAKPIMKQLKAISKQKKLAMKSVLMPIRYQLTGMDVGAGIGETIELLGKEVVLERLARPL